MIVIAFISGVAALIVPVFAFNIVKAIKANNKPQAVFNK